MYSSAIFCCQQEVYDEDEGVIRVDSDWCPPGCTRLTKEMAKRAIKKTEMGSSASGSTAGSWQLAKGIAGDVKMQTRKAAALGEEATVLATTSRAYLKYCDSNESDDLVMPMASPLDAASQESGISVIEDVMGKKNKHRESEKQAKPSSEGEQSAKHESPKQAQPKARAKAKAKAKTKAKAQAEAGDNAAEKIQKVAPSFQRRRILAAEKCLVLAEAAYQRCAEEEALADPATLQKMESSIHAIKKMLGFATGRKGASQAVEEEESRRVAAVLKAANVVRSHGGEIEDLGTRGSQVHERLRLVLSQLDAARDVAAGMTASKDTVLQSGAWLMQAYQKAKLRGVNLLAKEVWHEIITRQMWEVYHAGRPSDDVIGAVALLKISKSIHVQEFESQDISELSTVKGMDAARENGVGEDLALELQHSVSLGFLHDVLFGYAQEDAEFPCVKIVEVIHEMQKLFPKEDDVSPFLLKIRKA